LRLLVSNLGSEVEAGKVFVLLRDTVFSYEEVICGVCWLNVIVSVFIMEGKGIWLRFCAGAEKTGCIVAIFDVTLMGVIVCIKEVLIAAFAGLNPGDASIPLFASIAGAIELPTPMMLFLLSVIGRAGSAACDSAACAREVKHNKSAVAHRNVKKELWFLLEILTVLTPWLCLPKEK